MQQIFMVVVGMVMRVVNGENRRESTQIVGRAGARAQFVPVV